MKRFTGFVLLLLLGLFVVSLGRTPEAHAGIFNANGEVTYKEYWIPHTQFTGGCDDTNQPTHPSGTFFSEPGELAKCPKEMNLSIVDNFQGALKAEIYVDLWRNYDTKSARLRINNGAVMESPRGYDWSRTPWVQEIPLNSLIQGTNKFLFWAGTSRYHIHDVAVRIYFDDAHPLLVNGNPVTAPDGELVSIESQDFPGVAIPAYDGGQLIVNDDQLTFTASVEEGAKVVEFHAYYDGYDDDNDGKTRDWHNVGRNNWWPGGKPGEEIPPIAGNGTINHIGSKGVPPGPGPHEIEIVWEMPHIINQAGVKFKIRVIDANGVAREGAGGVTPAYSLVRYYPVVAYTMPDFDDFGLHMDGSRPDEIVYDFPLPDDLNLAGIEGAYLLGMYWRTPKVSINGSNPSTVRLNTIGETDSWTLAVRPVTKSLLKPGNNAIRFVYNAGQGNFIEHPGPMIVLRSDAIFAPDVDLPFIVSRVPNIGSTDVDIFAPVTVKLGDTGSGIDTSSVVMSVNNQLVQPVLSGPANNLTVTFTPTNPFPPSSTIPVTIYACDLAGNCMTAADQYSFTTEAPDVTPPVISNINVQSTDVGAVVTWTTDETADSKVEYGLTTGYEKPAVTDGALITQHSLNLTGLTANTTYNYRLTSADFNGNAAVTTNLTFQTKQPPGAIKSDDFGGCALNTSVWSFINPKSDAVLGLTGTGAQIAVPAGTSHDLWRQGLQAPRLMQFITNQNFDVEVKFDTLIDKKTQSMGLLVQQDTNNWLRFNFQNDGVGTNSLVAVSSVNNAANAQVIFSTPVTITPPSYMRLNRAGDLWNLQYSTDGVNWTFATTITRTLNATQIGPFVGNTSSNPAHTGIIDHFENLAAPLPESETPITLDVVLEGLGTVTPDPNKTSYNCNETVTLTAAPALDWTWGGWSGAIDSINLVETITLTKPETVTATFINNTLYTMNVNVVSQGDGVGGTFGQNPQQGGYLYGSEVELTAMPTPGWSFLGWTGDWNSLALTTTVPITGNMDITATFDEDEYTLDTLIIAEGVGLGGEIDVSPVQDTYLYGDEVTLTVMPEPGWTFVGWEGEGVSGTSETLVLNMTQNVVAIARLAQDQYDVDVDVINNGETPDPQNAVLKAPPQETYGYGQAITLTASAELGWLFTGWSGDLTGTALSETLVITESKAISATFTQQHYSVTVTSEGPGSVDIQPTKDYYLYGDVVTLTPIPQTGHEFVLWSGDITGTTEPVFIAIEKNLTAEALFAVDTTPIEIVSHEIEVLPGGTLARVTWITDVPGDSRVDFGETTFYEGGAVSEDDLVTEHNVVLTGLEPETFYHYQITSTDGSGNSAQTEDLSFSTSASSGLVSDDFSSCELDSRWTWVDPLGDSTHAVTGQGVEISVPADSIHNIWSTGYDVPRLMQPSNNTDFIIEVKFDSLLTAGGTGQGIVIEQDAQNFLRFDFFVRTFEAPNPPEIVVFAATFTNLDEVVLKNTKVTDFSAPMYMRVVRTGNTWQQWYSFNGEDWTKNVEFNYETVVKKVGVFAANPFYKGEVRAHTGVIDYFFNTASPIDPEDSRYKLDFSYEGSGQVTPNPNQPGYYCGQEVVLTAVGASGWGFAGWGGDLTGSDPTRTINVTEDMAITARFQFGTATYRLLLPMITNP